jgi:hypothetical protein
MLKENGELWSDIAPYIRPFPMANQRHVNGRIIDTSQAFTLNFWDTHVHGNIIHPPC